MSDSPIIAVVGAPRTGKSYLAARIAEHIGGTLFLEDDGHGYPERMKENLAQNIRPLERQLWFRTTCIERHLKAKELQRQGIASILDIFWLTTHMYVDVLLEGFERELMRDILRQDEMLVGYPDVIVYLTQSEAGTRDLIVKGGRSFDASDTYYEEIVRPAHELHEAYFSAFAVPGVPVISIDRTGLVFEDPVTFDTIMAQIRAHVDV
jgi:deoxyadenosine/deoxycytidine kinase